MQTNFPYKNLPFPVFKQFPHVYRVWEECGDCDWFVGFCTGEEAAQWFTDNGYIVERTNV